MLSRKVLEVAHNPCGSNIILPPNLILPKEAFLILLTLSPVTPLDPQTFLYPHFLQLVRI